MNGTNYCMMDLSTDDRVQAKCCWTADSTKQSYKSIRYKIAFENVLLCCFPACADGRRGLFLLLLFFCCLFCFLLLFFVCLFVCVLLFFVVFFWERVGGGGGLFPESWPSHRQRPLLASIALSIFIPSQSSYPLCVWKCVFVCLPACVNGRWGTSCSNRCGHCTGSVCDKQDGRCTCQTGWAPPTCTGMYWLLIYGKHTVFFFFY